MNNIDRTGCSFIHLQLRQKLQKFITLEEESISGRKFFGFHTLEN